MSRKFSIAYFAHSIRSDWNNGNAHFLRGLLSSMNDLKHDVVVFEPADEWSLRNLHDEKKGQQSLEQFATCYPDLVIRPYDMQSMSEPSYWREMLAETDIVILHEWNPPEIAEVLLDVRRDLHFKLIFHDTHHRASSSPEQLSLFGIAKFDGVIAFGETLRRIYSETFGIERVWTLHEAADTDVFKPKPNQRKITDVVWVGNWGDGERSAEIKEYLLAPAEHLREQRFCVYGVRYPNEGLVALREAGVQYGGYLPNLEAPGVYASARLTVHIPRQQYVHAMTGIPTIRVFEALACGIPLISAPWNDSEHLFRENDFLVVRNTGEMRRAMEHLLDDPEAATAQAKRGLQTVLERHTCRHRAEQLTTILEEIFT